MAIHQKLGYKNTHHALDDWYDQRNMDYDAFASKYPLNGELDRQTSKLEAMYKWCQAESSFFTPTIYINGHQLPRKHEINDLIEVLK